MGQAPARSIRSPENQPKAKTLTPNRKPQALNSHADRHLHLEQRSDVDLLIQRCVALSRGYISVLLISGYDLGVAENRGP